MKLVDVVQQNPENWKMFSPSRNKSVFFGVLGYLIDASTGKNASLTIDDLKADDWRIRDEHAPECMQEQPEDVGVLNAILEAEKMAKWIPEKEAEQTIAAQEQVKASNDSVEHPSHYTSVVPNIECIDVVKYMNFCIGGAIKYLWRAGHKDRSKHVEDLRKAIKLIEFEIQRIIEKEN